MKATRISRSRSRSSSTSSVTPTCSGAISSRSRHWRPKKPARKYQARPRRRSRPCSASAARSPASPCPARRPPISSNRLPRSPFRLPRAPRCTTSSRPAAPSYQPRDRAAEEAVGIIATRMIGDRRRVLIETEVENRLTREFATELASRSPPIGGCDARTISARSSTLPPSPARSLRSAISGSPGRTWPPAAARRPPSTT